MFLFDVAAHPVETHVKSLGALPAHVVGEDSVGGRDVGLDWSERLQVAHFYEGRADGNRLLVVEENRSSFVLRGGEDGLTFGEYWSIWSGSGPDVGRRRIIAYVVVARSATARFWMDEIRCVAIDVEAHVASVETDDGVRLFGCVVHGIFVFLMLLVVDEACSVPISLSATSMVGLTAREM